MGGPASAARVPPQMSHPNKSKIQAPSLFRAVMIASNKKTGLPILTETRFRFGEFNSFRCETGAVSEPSF
jgi:hypothetical protein